MQASRADNGSAAGDDLSLYSFENVPATAVGIRTLPLNAAAPAAGSNAPPLPPPVQHHRLSEPNMAHHMHHTSHTNNKSSGSSSSHPSSHSPMRPRSSFNPSHQLHQSNYHSHQHPVLPSFVNAQKMSPIELHPATASPRALVSDSSRFGDSSFSPSRRTSYPQMHAHTAAATVMGQAISVHSRTPNTSDIRHQRQQQKPTHVSNYQRHNIQTLSPPQPMPSAQYPGRASANSIPPQTLAAGAGMATPSGHDSPSVSFSPGNMTDVEPEKTCRYVLDMLETQVRRIDAQQDTLNQLRISTRNAMAKVEQVLQRHTRPN
ncbi:hypothetical protein COEREDRAFT_83375 [Coemansia reversa NRRL 1564]|uniref:Uncharacterized protein n=1 Tax=Coemansia reversa (strain ATCC 12441 / NRRL 1564) TaxID=763665 RepID=A0A2G5B3L4_COERN|nr:hypothetical protein COEREDRAFT_83375 [Coemansia reversa NRRL 1564]|eukprot:PIA13609.1 hypothetical protein COEREDRAFT_83375 [Coemansia reversa NRRL 1564]